MSRKKHLLLCFDAFGTLFTPKKPVPQQYGEVARSLGFTGFTDEQVATSFREAFKKESTRFPNYGKAEGMNAAKWWTNIITNTFTPLIGPSKTIQDELAPRLIYRFATEEGYRLYSDVIPLMQQLPKTPFQHGKSGKDDSGQETRRIVVGLVTNSDDRAAEVLISLGLRVAPYRFGKPLVNAPSPDEVYDVDFSVISYDVGFEKPDGRMFEAAETMLKESPLARGTDVEGEWEKIYVGDEYDKDAVGAANAGWKAVLIDRSDSRKPLDGVIDLDDGEAKDLAHVLDAEEKTTARFRSLQDLAKWLPKAEI